MVARVLFPRRKLGVDSKRLVCGQGQAWSAEQRNKTILAVSIKPAKSSSERTCPNGILGSRIAANKPCAAANKSVWSRSSVNDIQGQIDLYIMDRMDIKGRILQLIRRRKDGILLCSDITAFGSGSQVSGSLVDLQVDGRIVRVELGVYVMPAKLAVFGIETLLQKAHQRQAKVRRKAALVKWRAGRITATARYVSNLARQQSVVYKPTFCDRWASATTRLAGDEITPDATDDLLVALTRSGALSPGALVKLVMAHHRALKANI